MNKSDKFLDVKLMVNWRLRCGCVLQLMLNNGTDQFMSTPLAMVPVKIQS